MFDTYKINGKQATYNEYDGVPVICWCCVILSNVVDVDSVIEHVYFL